MNKIIKTAFALFAIVLMAACSEDLPRADFNRYEIDGLQIETGDESVSLSWAPQAGKPDPIEYLITWTSPSPDAPGGRLVLPAEKKVTVISGLKNNINYTFGVQARYPEGLANKVTVQCKPMSTRIAVKDFKAMAGDKRAFLAWTVPTTNLAYSYKLDIKANGSVVKTVSPEKGANSILVEGLANGTEYTFALTCVYAHGNSDTMEATATPGEISPMSMLPTQPRVYELTKIEYNPAYFVMGEIASVEWIFEDGSKQTTSAASYKFPKVGVNKVEIKVNYSNGKSETASLSVEVLPFAWTDLDGTGYQKSSTMVFSHDAQHLYTVGQGTKTLYSVNAITGKIDWEFVAAGATYGAGPAVAKNGSIIFGTESADGDLYAISPNGTQRWNVKMGSTIKAAPAVTSDGVVYALCDGGKLGAYDLETGAEKWTAQQSGNSGGLAVDADGTIYMGTSDGVWAYSASGTMKWKSSEVLKTTARGGNVVIGKDYVYVTMLAKAGVAAINKADGTVAWKFATTYGDCYNPVVDNDGTVYFNEKAGGLYAVNKDGSLKWKYTEVLNYTFSGFALGADGKAYISQYATPFNLIAINATGVAEVVTTIGAQTMSPLTIGPDKRIYFGKNGSIGCFNAEVALANTIWPCRGGNHQATNSLR